MRRERHELHIFTREEVVRRLEAARNKTLGEIDAAGVFERARGKKKVTGIAGDVIEQSVFGYPPDSYQEPDLLIDYVPTELKTTGLRPSKKVSGLEAKEPMSITAVSLGTITREDFEHSHFWRKLRNLLIVYYLYDAEGTVEALDYARFPVKGYQFNEFSDEEKEILKNDWELVRSFLFQIEEECPSEEERKKRYPLLSSALRDKLMFIDTAPKYPHPPRFRLKRGTVTAIARKAFGDSMEQLPTSITTISLFDDELRKRTAKLVGLTVAEVFEALGESVPREGKAIVSRMLVRVLGGTGRFSDIDLFVQAEIEPKTCILTRRGGKTEDMKMLPLDFGELSQVDLSFEESSAYDYFRRHFYIAVLEEPSSDAHPSVCVFRGFKRLDFSDAFIDQEVKPTWETCRDLVAGQKLRLIPVLNKKTGKPIVNKTGVERNAPNFPKSSEHKVFVRGTGSDSTRKPVTVNGLSMYRQNYWVHGSYIAELLRAAEFV